MQARASRRWLAALLFILTGLSAACGSAARVPAELGAGHPASSEAPAGSIVRPSGVLDEGNAPRPTPVQPQEHGAHGHQHEGADAGGASTDELSRHVGSMHPEVASSLSSRCLLGDMARREDLARGGRR